MTYIHCLSFWQNLAIEPALPGAKDISPVKRCFIFLNCVHDCHFSFFRNESLLTISNCHFSFLKSPQSVVLHTHNHKLTYSAWVFNQGLLCPLGFPSAQMRIPRQGPPSSSSVPEPSAGAENLITGIYYSLTPPPHAPNLSRTSHLMSRF